MTATMSVKGQITMPKPIREKCGLVAGDKLHFLLRNDGVLELVPVKQPASHLKGMLRPLKKTVSIEQMNEAIAQGACDDERD